MIARRFFTPIIQALLFTYLSTQAYGMDVAVDIRAQIKEKAKQREENFWTPLKRQNKDLICSRPVHLLKKVKVNESNNTIDSAISRRSYNDTVGTSVETAIPSFVYLSEDVENALVPPKGVIIKVYGSKTPLKANHDDNLIEEKIWAANDYIVYCLNLRGTAGFGSEFLHAQGNSHGVQTLVRDISYFTYLLRNGEQDSYGRRAFASNLVTKTTPCFLTGASFGGYLTLYQATNFEEAYNLRQFDVTIKHRDMFDGYIASMAPTDIWRDVKSGTTSGTSRLGFFTGSYKGNHSVWIKNAYQGRNVVDREGDNIKLSPLYRMDLLRKPVLYMHGLKDKNVSPKQSIDCIKSGITSSTQGKLFCYFDNNLGHHFPASTEGTERFYEMQFRFMDGVALACATGMPFKSIDKIEHLIPIAHLRFRTINPDVNRPVYQFIYESIRTYHSKKPAGDSNQHWELFKESNGDLYISALVWMKEKERISFDRQNRRHYLDQKDAMKNAYKAHRANLTHWGEVTAYFGDGDPKSGEIKIKDFEVALKTKLQKILYTYRHDLILGDVPLLTRLG